MLTDHFISKFIENLPNSKNPLKLDIVFEGGLFNGSYLVGCLLYLKQLEDNKFIEIHKISGCSIGSILAILYFIDNKNLYLEMYEFAYTHFKKNHNINIFDEFFSILKFNLPKDIVRRINNRVYICYYNVQKGKRIIKNKYKDIDDIFETIRRSCSFPYIIDNNFLYKNQFIDGLYPYIFKRNKNKRILYLNIHKLDKIMGMLSIKNEPSNVHRIFAGIIDINTFFVSKNSTNICSFIDTWDIFDKVRYFIFLNIIKIFVLLIFKCYIINEIIRNSFENEKLNIYLLINNLYIKILNMYFI